ncbi:MAG: ABC transporter substrate-binding protein [Betaproteobacteria bacterium]|nr:ABC transporter substrate-binding protein [Betaproteobacteria bacterium]
MTAAASLVPLSAWSQAKRYDPGASDTEISIGNIVPYSGPASAYGVIGRALGAYFARLNAEGGIGGRKIRYVSVDDGYSPPRTVEQARRLVEHEKVLFITQVLGTAPNVAIQRYLNQRRVPQLFVATGATRWGDPVQYPFTMGWQPSYQSEARVYAEHILETRPAAKIAVLLQNDDYGRDYLKGLQDGLGDRAARMIVAQSTYEVTDPTIDSQLIRLMASGADTFFNITTPKFAAQAIRKAFEIGWRPQQYLNSVSNAVASVMLPAGAEASTGIISSNYIKDPTDPQWAGSAEHDAWLEWMRRWHPGGDVRDSFNVYAYSVAQTIEQVLRQCGNELTRDNVMRQAANLDFTLPMLLPGVRVRTAPDDYFPIESLQLMRFSGRGWERFGKIYGG